MAPSDEHACKYLRDIERLVLKVDILTSTVEQRLEKGEQRFAGLEDKLDRLDDNLQERRQFESKLEGGYRFFMWILGLAGTCAAVFTVPHFWAGK